MARLGLGLAALGRPGYINLDHARDLAGHTEPAALERRCHEVLDAAWAAGVRYFDAARSYGRAEEFLASWIASRHIEGATVASKWGYTYTAGWNSVAAQHEVKDHSAAALKRQLAESRATLGRFDIYQIHSATLESGVLGDGAVLEEMVRLREEEGLLIGFTASGPKQAEVVWRALELCDDEGVALFDVVQATWNLCEQSAAPALAEAHARGLEVIVKEALANGRLTARNPDPRLRPLKDAARRFGVGEEAIALGAALRLPFVDVVLSGATTVEQVRQNAASRQLPPAVISELLTPPAQYWAERAQMPWT